MRSAWFVATLLALAPLTAADANAATTRITGSIVDDVSGAPVPDARVVVFAFATGKDRPTGQPDAKRFDVRVDANGRFAANLEAPWQGPGKFYVIASARGHVELRPTWTPGGNLAIAWKVEPEYATGAPVELALRLKRGPTLAGTVVDEAGQPVSGAHVTLTFAGAGWSEWPQSFTIGPLNWPDDTVTDAQGRWEMLSTPFEAKAASAHKDGEFVVTVSHDRYTPLIVPAVERMPAANGVITLASLVLVGRSMQGRVVDVDGKPVSDAALEVTGLQRPDDPGASMYFKSVRSGKDGRFTVEGLDDRTWIAKATASGHGPSEVVKFTLRSKQPIEVRLLPGHEFSGRLLDEDGHPITGTAVFIYDDRYHATDARTGDDGRFRFTTLLSGKYTLGAYNLFEREVTIPGPSIEVRLEPRRQVVVTLVRKEDGKPIPPPAALTIRSKTTSWSHTLERQDGTIDVGNLAPAEYTFYAKVPGRAIGIVRTKLLAGKKEPARPIVEVPLGFTLRGQVRDREGHPVKDARVNVTGILEDRNSTVTDGEGVYELKGLSDSYISMGSGYMMFVEAPGYAPWDSVEVFMRLGIDRRLDVTLDRGATVRGRVVYADGKAADHVKVTVSGKRKFLMADYWVSSIMPSGVTDADGRYVIEHVPPGDITLLAGPSSKDVKAESGKDLTVDWTL